MSGNKQQGYECPKCKNNYSTAYSMYRHMRKVHNCDINRCVTLYCPIENCNQSYDRYNALDTHLTHVHYADIRKETFNFSDLQDFETWLRDITSSSKTKYIKRSCNNSYRYYRCHRSGLPKTSTDKINSMKSTVKIGRHCPSRIIAKITDGNVQVEFVPTHIGHECEIAKIPLSQKKRQDIACRLSTSTSSSTTTATPANVPVMGDDELKQRNQSTPISGSHHQVDHDHLPQLAARAANQSSSRSQQSATNNNTTTNPNSMNSINNPQSTAPSIIQNDNSLMVTLAPMKTTTSVALPNQQQLASHHLQQQQLHIISSTSHQLSQQPPRAQLTNGTNLNLLIVTDPNRQELTNRFEQLMSIIRSDKHASIVKAQLEVCFALIRD